MRKVCIILVYFGPLPEWFSLWLLSCHYNPTISFLIVTDQQIILPEGYNNIKILPMTLNQMKKLADNKLEIDTALVYPYKCCDLRPAYGLIFKDYLKEYEFWGHCDCDLIFGDLRKYFTEDRLRDYNRIFGQGHLSIYRNTPQCNNFFKLSPEYKKVFTTSSNFGFDEDLNKISIGRVLNKNQISVLFSREFVDIGTIHRRFLNIANRNSVKQIFYWNKGRIYRDYQNDFLHIQERDEFAYIHFKKRKLKKWMLPENVDQTTSFAISYKGFFPLDNKDFEQLVTKYNPYPGILFETAEQLRWYAQHSGLEIRKLYNLIRKI